MSWRDGLAGQFISRPQGAALLPLTHRWRNFQAAPVTLRVVIVGSLMMGVVLPVVPFVPGVEFRSPGGSLSGAEIWDAHVPYALFLLALLMVIVGLAVLARARWARQLLIALPVLQLLPFQVLHWVFSAPDPIPSVPGYLILVGVWVLCASLYLFAVDRPRLYFEGDPARHRSGEAVTVPRTAPLAPHPRSAGGEMAHL